MADAIGIAGIHNVSGKCDLCGRGVDALSEELNALDCTYQDCPPLVYHQDCLEKYLKSIRLEKNRKTGFKCPRGCGKGSTSDACPGKIDKSHPIHPRNDLGKKRKKAKPPPEPPQRAKPTSKKDKKEKEKARSQQESKAEKGKGKGQPGVLDKAQSVPNSSFIKPFKSEGLSCSASISSENSGTSCDPRKSFSSVSSGTHSSTASSGSRRDSQDFVMRTSSVPIFSPWSKPVTGASSSQVRTKSNGNRQVPDINSMSAFPPALSGSASEEVKVVGRSSSSLGQNAPQGTQPSCWSSTSRPLPVPNHSRTSLAGDGGLHPQHQSLPNSSLGSGELPGSMDCSDAAIEAKLTKAQKKNMKRAERKKKTAVVDAQSLSRTSSATAPSVTPISDTPGNQTPAPPSDDSSTRAANDHDPNFVLADLFHDSLVAWKTLHHIRQLQTLGFEGWQSAAAVTRFGSNMERAIAWLLDGDVEIDEPSLWRGRGSLLPEVDISTELNYVRDAQDVLALPESILQQAVVDCDGDLDAAISSVIENHEVGKKHVQIKEPQSPPQSQDVPGEGGLPFSMNLGSEQTTSMKSTSFESSLHRDYSHPAPVMPQMGWPSTISDQLMLGGVLGSKLEEYKRGNANFTALANKELISGLRPSTPQDSSLLGINRGGIEGSPSSGLDFLSPGQLLGRTMGPGDSGMGGIVSDVDRYNRLLSGDVGIRNPMQCAGGAFGGAIGGINSTWGFNQAHMGYTSAPMAGDVHQDEQNDYRHLIGNLLEG